MLNVTVKWNLERHGIKLIESLLSQKCLEFQLKFKLKTVMQEIDNKEIELHSYIHYNYIEENY